jgi:hypothetical protein
MYAVLRSSPPKQMFVQRMSSVWTNSTSSPLSPSTTLIPPFTSVARHTLPSPSTASESKPWRPPGEYRSVPPCGKTPGTSSISPGAVTFHHQQLLVKVSAT